MRGEDFKKVRRVYHIGRKEFGVVTSTANETVTVEFGNATARGGRNIGIFDGLWFDLHPLWLIDAKQAPQQTPGA